MLQLEKTKNQRHSVPGPHLFSPQISKDIIFQTIETSLLLHHLQERWWRTWLSIKYVVLSTIWSKLWMIFTYTLTVFEQWKVQRSPWEPSSPTLRRLNPCQSRVHWVRYQKARACYPNPCDATRHRNLKGYPESLSRLGQASSVVVATSFNHLAYRAWSPL